MTNFFAKKLFIEHFCISEISIHPKISYKHERTNNKPPCKAEQLVMEVLGYKSKDKLTSLYFVLTGDNRQNSIKMSRLVGSIELGFITNQIRLLHI